MKSTGGFDETGPFFPCSWDAAVWTATSLAVGILIALASILAINGFLLFSTAPSASGLCFLGSAATLCVVMALSQYGITGYRIEPGAIVVVRRRGSVRIPSASIQALTLVEKGALDGTRRIYGTGWIFGNTDILAGPYWQRIQVYITRKESLVLIERANDIPVLLSPDNPRAFIQTFHSARGTEQV